MLSLKKFKDLKLSIGNAIPLGYVVVQNVATKGKPVYAYKRRVDKIPTIFRNSVLNESNSEQIALENAQNKIIHKK